MHVLLSVFRGAPPEVVELVQKSIAKYAGDTAFDSVHIDVYDVKTQTLVQTGGQLEFVPVGAMRFYKGVTESERYYLALKRENDKGVLIRKKIKREIYPRPDRQQQGSTDRSLQSPQNPSRKRSQSAEPSASKRTRPPKRKQVVEEVWD